LVTEASSHLGNHIHFSIKRRLPFSFTLHHVNIPRAKAIYNDIPYIYYVHPYRKGVQSGDYGSSKNVITSITATIGGGFFGGLLFGYAIKKVVKLIADNSSCIQSFVGEERLHLLPIV
jgi:hypothetical protein